MNPAHRQHVHPARFDWGLVGAAAIGGDADITIVVDVLSFTTTLSVAMDRGIEVFPYRWRDSGAARYAEKRNAVLAVARSAGRGEAVSLSPSTVRRARGIERLVLPSPNGSSIAHSLAASSGACIGASLRNAGAVAEWVSAHVCEGSIVSVIAAGERWPDGSLRPAVEDLWGAGAVLATLRERTASLTLSPEAESAVAAWRSVADRIDTALTQCASGRELIDAGCPSDVEIAAEIDESRSVPVLNGERFVDYASAEVSVDESTGTL